MTATAGGRCRERGLMPSHPNVGALRIAMLGTRGVPARYGGFETAVEEIGARLAQAGHQVTVYGRTTGDDASPVPQEHKGMRLVHLPAVRHRVFETLSHSMLSVAHAMTRENFDVAFVFNAANAAVLPALRVRGVPTAMHVDGLEWRRAKWQGLGKAYYRISESLSVRWADALIADSTGIADYYRDEFGAPTVFLPYGAPDLSGMATHRLHELGLADKEFHLVVARFEPENHVDLMMRGYLHSKAEFPLVVAGSNPYPTDYTRELENLASGSPSVRMLGGVWDQDLLDQLYAGSLTYLHGHSVGGTNPSMLRAMGAGACVIAHDNVFNRDMLGGGGELCGLLASEPEEVARALEAAETDPDAATRRGALARSHAVARYDWDDVAAGYEVLARDLASGHSTRGVASGRRAVSSGWTASSEPGRAIGTVGKETGE